MKEKAEARLSEAYAIKDKKERSTAVRGIENEVKDETIFLFSGEMRFWAGASPETLEEIRRGYEQGRYPYYALREIQTDLLAARRPRRRHQARAARQPRRRRRSPPRRRINVTPVSPHPAPC